MRKKVRVTLLFLLFLLINIMAYALIYVFPPVEKKPVIIRRDSYGNIVSPELDPPQHAFGLSDSVFVSFFRLDPKKRYYLSIERDDKEITNLALRSDERGVITTTALWWNLGFNYDAKAGKEGIDPDFAKYEYKMILKDDRFKPVIEPKIPVSTHKDAPYVYTCDEHGSPKNTFIRNQENVYIIGCNLEKILPEKVEPCDDDGNKDKNDEDRKLYIYLVKNRWSWRLGDRVDGKTILKEKYVETLNEEAPDFMQMIWQKDDLEVGGYDIIVSGRNIGILLKTDVIESNYGVGFKVVDDPEKELPREKKDIIRQLTCQMPPRIPEFGNLDKPRAAVYKDYFSPMEQVWVALETRNPTTEQRDARKARIYVLEHQAGKIYNDGEPLCDESGGYEEVLLQPQCARAVFTPVWCKPSIPETQDKMYDVVIDFNCNGFYDKGLDILDTGDKGGFYVPKRWVCLESLSLNHTKNAVCSDAVTIRYRLNKKLRIPEWVKGRRSFPAAYVKDSRIAVLPGFISSAHITTATLKAYAVSGSLGDIIVAQTYLNPQTSSPGINTSSRHNFFQVVTNTPGKINSFYQQWEWYLMGINNDSYNEEIHIGTTINKIYIILDVPQSPWTLAGDTAPWSDILDLCCQVAHNESEPEAAAQRIVQFLYGEVGARYEKKDAPYSKENNAHSDFQLTQFHNSIPTVKPFNCYDMGKALVTYGNVLGCNLTLRYCKPFGHLNCIEPVGKSRDCTMHFRNHAFASIGDNIFDASLKVNSRGNPDQKTYRADWMIDIPWFQYKEIVAKKMCVKSLEQIVKTNRLCDDVLKEIESLTREIAVAQPPYPQIAIFKIEKNRN
jgi:hypothetical protein